MMLRRLDLHQILLDHPLAPRHGAGRCALSPPRPHLPPHGAPCAGLPDYLPLPAARRPLTPAQRTSWADLARPTADAPMQTDLPGAPSAPLLPPPAPASGPPPIPVYPDNEVVSTRSPPPPLPLLRARRPRQAPPHSPRPPPDPDPRPGHLAKAVARAATSQPLPHS